MIRKTIDGCHVVQIGRDAMIWVSREPYAWSDDGGIKWHSYHGGPKIDEALASHTHLHATIVCEG
jgi:hypothetical protein